MNNIKYNIGERIYRYIMYAFSTIDFERIPIRQELLKKMAIKTPAYNVIVDIYTPPSKEYVLNQIKTQC